MKFSKKVITSMLVFLVLFTIAVLFISFKTGSEPSSLVVSVFGFCGIEGGCLALIKSAEAKAEKKPSTKKKSK